ncbi:hypothetical protein OSTOST_01990, partial [Ostertagia ostertagi]
MFPALNYLDCRENSRKRTIDAPSCSRDADEEPPEPLVKMKEPLRKSQSLRAMAVLIISNGLILNLDYSAPVVALARQLAELNAEQVANSERKAVEEALVVELGRLEAEHREEVEEAADEVREEHVVTLPFNSRISTPHPTFQQSMIYAAVFKLHFGVSEKMAGFLDDFLAMKGVFLPEP